MKSTSLTVARALRYVILFASLVAVLFSGVGQAFAYPVDQGNSGSVGARTQSPAPSPTSVPGSPVLRPTPTAAPRTSPPVATPRPATTMTYKWIDVNLTKQLLIAYQGNRAVFSTYISSGVAKHKTPTGVFHIYAKLRSQEMIGGVGIEHYDLPNVPWVMYFYGGNAIHGTYWHHNFGHPMSHGCVNASITAASWLYRWAPMGTTVRVHY